MSCAPLPPPPPLRKRQQPSREPLLPAPAPGGAEGPGPWLRNSRQRDCPCLPPLPRGLAQSLHGGPLKPPRGEGPQPGGSGCLAWVAPSFERSSPLCCPRQGLPGRSQSSRREAPSPSRPPSVSGRSSQVPGLMPCVRFLKHRHTCKAGCPDPECFQLPCLYLWLHVSQLSGSHHAPRALGEHPQPPAGTLEFSHPAFCPPCVARWVMGRAPTSLPCHVVRLSGPSAGWM